VRLSRALTAWVKLGKKYPKALVKLKEVRDEKVKQIRSGFCQMDSFLEVEAINRVLDENEKTIALFKHIDKFEPVLAKEWWPVIKPLMNQFEETELIEKYDRIDQEKRALFLADAKPVDKSSPLLGEWVPEVTCSSGLGSSWSFNAAGTCKLIFGAIITSTYTFNNDQLIVYNSNGTQITIAVKFDDDKMFFTQSKNDKPQEHTRISDEKTGIVGKWSSIHYTDGKQFSDFTANNNYYLTVPFIDSAYQLCEIASTGQSFSALSASA